MKTISDDLKAHLALEVTTLASCWKVTRTDGTVFHFTDHDQDLVIDGDTYVASSGYARTAIASELGYAVDNADVQGAFSDDSITEDELRAGVFDYAEITLFIVNWADTSQGKLQLRRGWFGETMPTKQGIFSIELRGLMQKLQQQIGRVYQAECDWDLGDPATCAIVLLPDDVARDTDYALGDYVRVPDPGTSGTPSQKWRNVRFKCTTPGTSDSSAPSYDYTAGNDTTDGTAIFTAEEAFTRTGVVATGTETTAADHKSFNVTIDEARAVDGWFEFGAITFEAGDNAGKTIEVRGWTETDGIVQLYLAAPFAPAIGDVFYIWPGCNKDLQSGCHDKFDNVLNFGGFPYIPGSDFVVQYAANGQV